MLLPAITGKVEMVYEGEQQGVEMVARQLLGAAVKAVFDRRFPEVGKELGSGGEDDDGPYAAIVGWFAGGGEVEVSDEQDFAAYEAALAQVPGLLDLAARHWGGEGQERAFAAELLLEGLHQHTKLARHDLDSRVSYKELVRFQLMKPRRRGSGSSEVH
jgi:magnesium chelatase subunit I